MKIDREKRFFLSSIFPVTKQMIETKTVETPRRNKRGHSPFLFQALETAPFWSVGQNDDVVSVAVADGFLDGSPPDQELPPGRYLLRHRKNGVVLYLDQCYAMILEGKKKRERATERDQLFCL